MSVQKNATGMDSGTLTANAFTPTFNPVLTLWIGVLVASNILMFILFYVLAKLVKHLLNTRFLVHHHADYSSSYSTTNSVGCAVDQVTTFSP